MKMKRIGAAVTVSNMIGVDQKRYAIDQLLDQIKIELINVQMKTIKEEYSTTYKVEVIIGSPDDYFADLQDAYQFINYPTFI